MTPMLLRRRPVVAMAARTALEDTVGRAALVDRLVVPVDRLRKALPLRCC